MKIALTAAILYVTFITLLVWNAQPSVDTPSACVINYNSALADIPHMKKQIEQLQKDVETLKGEKLWQEPSTTRIFSQPYQE